MQTAVRRYLAVGYLLILAGFGFFIRLYSWPQIEIALSNGPACPLRRWTGLLCAFCGMTHSWIAIFKGEWARAFQENILGAPFLAVTIAWALFAIAGKFKGDLDRRWSWGVLGLLLVYAIGRNLI